MTVLVTGATGNVGREVVRALRLRGAPVRAFVRDPDTARERLDDQVELVTGDFADAASLARALHGVDGAFLSSADGPAKVAHETAVIDACAIAGVRLVVKVSTLGADPGSPMAPFAWNGRSEEHLRRSGVPAVVLQSAFLMTNLLPAAEQIRRDRVLVAPAGAGRIAMIDPRDIGAVAAVVLADEHHTGRTYRLTGPEAIAYADVARHLSEATGTPVRFVDAPEEAAREGLAAAGMPDWLVEHLVGAFRLIRSGAMADVTDTVRALTGRDAGSFARFARRHAALFRAAAQPVVDAGASSRGRR